MTLDRGNDRAHLAASAVSSVLREVLGKELLAVYLHGSAVLGGFRWDRSDLDLLVLTHDPLTDVEVETLPVRLASLAYPANGLELSVLTASEAARPTLTAPRFQLHVATDGWDRGLKAVDGRARGGDPDLVLHLAVCRDGGLALVGPPPTETLAAVPSEAVRTAAVEEIRWALEHDPPPEYVVLTAARAWYYSETQQIVSKVQAGRWAVRELVASGAAGDVVTAAVERQTGASEGPSRRQALEWARHLLARLESA